MIEHAGDGQVLFEFARGEGWQINGLAVYDYGDYSFGKYLESQRQATFQVVASLT